MALQKSIFKQYIAPSFVIGLFIFGLIAGIDEFVAANSDFRVTIWDRLNGRGDVPEGRAEVSQQLAIQICIQYGQSQFGRNLLQSRFDNFSSRYNADLKVHTIFLDLTIRDQERDEIYIRCDISAVNRMILESRVKGLSGFGFFGS